MVMAFVLVVGGGFGISYSVSDKASMGIYIANANEVANIKKQRRKISPIKFIFPKAIKML